LIHNRYAPRAERLEDRRLLAGNIGVSIDGAGNVTLVGTANESDEAIVYIDYGTGDVLVEGLNGTTIDGGTDPVQIGEDATIAGNLRVFLKSGDDHFVVAGISPAGTEAVLEDVLSVAGDVSIWADGGSDDVGVANANIGGNLSLYAAGADNALMVHGVYVGVGGSGDLTVYGSDRDDFIGICYTEVHGDMNIRSFRGADTIVNVGVEIEGDATIITSRDSAGDTILLTHSEYEGSTRVITQGGGDDTLLMSRNEFASLDVYLNSGNDTVCAVGNTATSSVDINGGVGTDAIYRRGNAGIGDTDITGFETDVQGLPLPEECSIAVDIVMSELYYLKWWVFYGYDDAVPA
jgi:hypothetical protein